LERRLREEQIIKQNLKQIRFARVTYQIANAAASETLDAILKDLGDSSFAILVDESRDISVKEQLAIVLRYVNKRGHVIKRFLCITHVIIPQLQY
jgi:hypothetical protein